MTVDERLEKLIERHEALAQTVESLVSEQRAHIAEQRKRDARIDQLHSEMMLAIARLTNTGEAHNGQLADHQERIDKLEGR
jgi:hypothetical protein